MAVDYSEKVWKYLKNLGFNDYAIAGLMGNLYAESGLKFNIVENLCIKRLKEYYGITYTSDSYTAAVDNGTITRDGFLHPIPNKQYGYGLCQWTSPGRKSKLYDNCKTKGVSISDMETQLDYLVYELKNSFQSVYNTLLKATSIKEASDVVLIKFESPADKSDSVKNLRLSYGKKYYDLYHSTAGNKYNVGWNGSSGKWWYADTETTYLSNGWAHIKDAYYYFNNEGYAVEGLVEIDGKVYPFCNDPSNNRECALMFTNSNGNLEVIQDNNHDSVFYDFMKQLNIYDTRGV